MFRTFKIFSNKLLKTTQLKQFYCSKQSRFDQCFIITRVNLNDKPRILDLFIENFCKKEPCIVGAGIANTRNVFLENKIMDAMSQGMSLKCQSRMDGCLVGACVNMTLCPWDCDIMDQYAEHCNCSRMKNLLKFYAYVTRTPDLFNRCHENKMFEMAYLTTDKTAEGQGIGLNLVKKSIELAKDLSFNIVRCDATSVYTAKICEKLGMKMVWELPYKNYIGLDKKPILYPPPPHSSCKVFIHLPLVPNIK